jgi:MoxR-like ATPase
MARNPKRSLEEVVNKSDSDDEDYNDRAHYSRSTGRKSKSSPKKKSRPPTKKRRHDSDDGLTSDEEELSEDLSFDEVEEDSSDPEVPRNARGTRRRTTQSHRPTYEEPDSEEVLEDNGGEEQATPPRKSNVIKLRVPPRALQQPAQYLEYQRRVTRHTRDASEDIYALTNSGRHMETVERGTVSPEADMPARRASRAGRMANRTIIDEEDEDLEAEDVINETTLKDSMEVVESDVPQGVEGDTLQLNDAEHDLIDEGMVDEDVVPESENGDVKNSHTEPTDEAPTTRLRGRPLQVQSHEDIVEDAETNEEAQLRRSSRKQPSRSSQRKTKNDESDFEPEEEASNEEEDSDPEQHDSPRKQSQAREEAEDSSASRRPGLRKRPSRSRALSEEADEADELAEELEDLHGGRRFRRRPKQTVVSAKPRRNRKDVDYRIIRPELLHPNEDSDNEVTGSPSRRGRGGGGWQRTLFSTTGPFGGGGHSAILGAPGGPAAAGGADSDSSDDEGMQQPTRTGLGPNGAVAATHNQSADTAQAASGTPANLGKFNNKQALADADPLGVDMNVNFDHVGGLQGHIDQLKEMVSLPLLYPEIFQRFKITPPRGVLFHGPPGTGKTLMARALANSVSSEGRKVTFYMRKGADALSKWVGEAERQLRLLFEEARKNQPSIIFFDEIDGEAGPLNVSLPIINNSY